MRVMFLGSPDFATTPLEALADAGYTIVSVVTQPDRPSGRGRGPTPPPVKLAAQRLGLPVYQPRTLRDPDVIAHLTTLRPDIGIVAAYGEILRKNVLAIPSLGYLNIHPSLLPLHRGPTPVAGAILAGDSETGVTIMKLDLGMDSGPILAQATVDLPPTARTGALTQELFQIGSQLLLEVLPLYADGRIEPRPQDPSQSTVTRMLRKEDGKIDWKHPALFIKRMIHAYDPWPGAFTIWRSQHLKLLSAIVRPDQAGDATPGTIIAADRLLVATGSGALEALEIQPAGKRLMTGQEWLRGQRNALGQRFDTEFEQQES